MRSRLLILVGCVLLAGSAVWAQVRPEPYSLDQSLLRSVEGLKKSMESIDQANADLKMENDYLRQKIDAMDQEVQRPQAQVVPEPSVDEVVRSINTKEMTLMEKTMARKVEEYRDIADEYVQLQNRIEAKQQSIKAIRIQVASVQEEMERMQKQIQVLSSFSEDELRAKVRRLEDILKDTRSDLAERTRQRDMLRHQSGKTRAVAGEEKINKQLWTDMSHLEKDVRGLVKNQRPSPESPEVKAQRQERMTALDSEIVSLAAQLESLQKEIRQPPGSSGAAEDQTLIEYRRQLQEENSALREKMDSLRKLLDLDG